jgi:hypothetical protein
VKGQVAIYLIAEIVGNLPRGKFPTIYLNKNLQNKKGF